MNDLRTNKELGEEIARLREQAGMKQAELGAAAGLDQTAMSKVESGVRALAAGELVMIAAHLGVDAEALLHNEPAAINWRADGSDATREAMTVLNEVIADYFAFEAVGR